MSSHRKRCHLIRKDVISFLYFCTVINLVRMWVLFAVLNPIAESFKNLFSKKAIRKDIDPLLVSWGNNFLPIVFSFPLLFLIDLKFSWDYFFALFMTGSINIFAIVLYMKALSEGDISEVIPMLSFTPLFLLITSPILVGEFPHFWGVIGIILIVIGSYLLNPKVAGGRYLDPFKNLVRRKGMRYMLIVAVIWSVSSNYDKVAIIHSSVWQHIFFVNLFVFTGTTTIVALTGKLKAEVIRCHKKDLLIVSLCTVGTFAFHMTALSMTLVAYVVTLKRASGMISVFMGHFFLDEPNVKERLLGSAIMFAGIALILLT